MTDKTLPPLTRKQQFRLGVEIFLIDMAILGLRVLPAALLGGLVCLILWLSEMTR